MSYIELLKNNLQNSIMLFYTECVKLYSEQEAKRILSDTLKQYLNDYDNKDLLTNEISKMINVLLKEYKETANESQKLKLYEQINKLQDVLFVIKEANNG